MKDYSKINKGIKNRQVYDGEKLFKAQFYGAGDGKFVSVDGNDKSMMIIQNHTNPLNEGLLDKKAKFLTDENVYMLGNVIEIEDSQKKFMAVTEPKINNVYSEYRIREMNDTLVYTNDEEEEVLIEGIMASGMLYKDGSYTNQENVFEDNEMRAIILQCNEKSSQLKLFDQVIVNGRPHKVVKVDNETLKLHKNRHGILQFVILLDPFSKIEILNVVDNSKKQIRGVAKYARVKDKKLNSVSRELLCEYGGVKTGDYIIHTFDSNDRGLFVTETYMIYNLPVKYEGYDISLMYMCQNSFSMLDGNGKIVNIPYYFEDNRTRVDKSSENNYINQLDSSFMIVVQENEVTRRFLLKETERIILKGLAYKISGVSNHDEGLMHIGIELEKVDTHDDAFGVANYHSQIETLKNKNTMIAGVDKIFKGFEWEYTINNDGYDTNWSVNNDCVEISSFTNSMCKIKIVKKYSMGTIITLSALINEEIYTKEIVLE